MIKNLTSSSAHITLSSYSPPNIYGNGNMSGNLRYNTTTQAYEVYDGNNWIMVSQGATVGLSGDADSAIRWAIEKQREEADLKSKMERYPALKDAYDKFKMMEALAYDEPENA